MAKHILIVGANSYIAKGITPFLQQEGFTIHSATRSELDVTNEHSIVQFIEKHKQETFDGIIFCQGINPSINAKNSTAEHIYQMLSVNITGPILLMKHIHPLINKEAFIIFFSSIAAIKGSYDPAYASAKAAINGLIQSLASEFDAFRFNGIALGLVEDSPVYHQMTPEFREKHKQRMKDGKLITIEDISASILDVIKDRNLNRSIVQLTGGYTI